MALYRKLIVCFTYKLLFSEWTRKISELFNNRIIGGLHEGGAAVVSGKRHREWRRRGVYKSTAACAAQMGVNFRQSSGTVPPLWTDAACTIFPSGTGAVTNQSSDIMYCG